ncbi:MAG TPA: biotin synthase BioB [Aliidongia sp.]|nr:biotin synthase BioB [Aliidongia sp.]
MGVQALPDTSPLTEVASASARQEWSRPAIAALFELPFADLMHRAQTIHRRHFDPNKVQLSTLLSIKTGGCPEDCGYCAQSARFETGVKASKLMAVETVLEDARRARAAGATRYCMGAAWRSPKDHDLEQVCEMVEGVRALGMEACVTLGMLTEAQAQRLKRSGLDYYNHNIDTSPEYYDKVVTTRSFEDRLDTLAHVRDAGIHVCSGGIVGMGETRADRVGMLHTLANLPVPPESVPINMLGAIEGTPLVQSAKLDPLELVRMIAVARIIMPEVEIRLSAGREALNDEAQALCYLAGANSIFFGARLLTIGNPAHDRDMDLFDRLGITPLEGPLTPAS